LVIFGNLVILMKLTRRQEQFIENLIDLSQELDGPIHYSLLAERLGVSPFTAYDMLRLLEEKGMVASEYQVAEGKSGPGRAERLFFPLDPTNRGVAERFGVISRGDQEWKQAVLGKIREGQLPEKEFADELLARVPPDGPEYIRYCLEVMMVLAVRMRRHAGQRRFMAYLSDILPQDGPVSPGNLGLLGGFTFGFFAGKDRDREWSQMLLEHILQYQEIVGRLTPKERRLLADDLIAVFSPSAADPN
jgi:DNA-binding Lrp family transcriptional regulator